MAAKKKSKLSIPENMTVKKRDGDYVPFDSTFIKNAIAKANDSMKNKDDKISEAEISKITEHVVDELFGDPVDGTFNVDNPPEVEDIQDEVILSLKYFNHFDLAEEYKSFREKRTYNRLKDAKVMRDIHKQLTPDPKKKANQNANLDELSFGGRKGEAESTLLKYLARNDLMDEIDIVDLDMNRRYKHDLDSFFLGEHNCISCPIDPLLEKGFSTRQTDIRPAGSINTAFQLLAVIFQLQSLQQFGGVSATHLDVSMIPYVRMSFYKHYLTVVDILPFINVEKIKARLGFDKFEAKKISIVDPIYKGDHWYNFIRRYIAKKALKLTKKELNQAVEGMYHNLNTLQSRSGKITDCPAA